MKKRMVLLSALLTLGAFAAVTGCKRSDDDHYYTYDDMTFWNNQNSIGIITVTVDNTYSRQISQTQRAYDCNYSGSANFNLTSGYHSYYASATTGQTWNGTFYLDNSCLLYELY